MKKIALLVISAISLNAFAETYTYVGTLVKQGGYVGISTEHYGFIALDDSQFSGEQIQEVVACMGKKVKAKVENRGELSDLLMISCN